ncbi:MAG: T9SS type A sorting domain-containing protein, partial [Lentimicrobium sp.]|nr:T9SS type A sorting domain-containing protein [Lentimicrobium sp.]
PTTGDISNSYRFPDDLYILDSTYVVYCQNFRRTQAEAVHNHGHQLESIYKYISDRQDGNISMFVQNFSGWGDNNYTMPPIGRAGDTHHPPNTTSDYDYLNTTLVDSDIEDWKPAGGTVKQVNVDTWGNLVYAWPGDPDFSQRKESQWYLYWMQNMPGYQNTIPYNTYTMTNWWHFTSDWDLCYVENTGLYGSVNGIEDELGQKISIFPNPSNGKFTLQDQNLMITRAEIVDLNGNILATASPDPGSFLIEFNSRHLAPGMYFCRIDLNGKMITKKLIVVN